MSTSNIQNYLSNVFRPAYRFDSNTGEFKAVLNMYNINELFANTFSVGQFNIGDGGGNVYVGSNAGNPTDTLQDCYRNVAVGTAAGASISNVLDSVFVGYTAGANISNASNIIAIGKGVVTGGSDTIYIGVSAGNATGSNNLFIGHNIAPAGTVNNQLRIGLDSSGQTVFNADLSLNRIGIFTSNPVYPIDLRGSTYIQGGLDLSGSLNVSGISTFSSNVGIKGILNVSGASLFTSNVGVVGDLNVSGTFSSKNNVTTIEVTTAGTQTITAPSSYSRYLAKIKLIGGGGGGGGPITSGTEPNGGGGGGAGYITTFEDVVNAGTTLTFSIGAGGSGGGYVGFGSDGADGGSTTFKNLTALGGNGGKSTANGCAGGDGRYGGGGGRRQAGTSSGGVGYISSGSGGDTTSGGFGGSLTSSTGNNGVNGGTGGGPNLGGSGGAGGGSNAGGNGTRYGAGGGGGSAYFLISSLNGNFGGSGAPGAAIVDFYPIA